MTAPVRLSLLAVADPARPLAWRRGRPVPVRDFLRHVERVAAALPEAPAVVNLCTDRYAFLVTFCAALIRGQTSLLPPSRAPQAVREVLADQPGSATAAEDDAPVAGAPHLRLPPLEPGAADAPIPATPRIPADQVAAIGYTSGSTGAPQAHVKTWGSFHASTAGNLHMLRAHLREPFHLLATVPPQHMYGMEMSVLLPLFGNASVHAGKPLLPADVAAALAELPAPRVLVTTPVHLRALLGAGLQLPPLAALLSATAPMPPELARAAQARWQAPLLEVFGSTETCVIASRTGVDAPWTLYRGVHLEPLADGTRVSAPQLARPVTLGDLVEMDAQGSHFSLRGRCSDLLEMAGKRASLTDLNRRLRALEGVEDGVIFQPDAADALGVHRLAALVVAPARSAESIRAALREAMDPVFLPRPLHRVPQLPRNATGKLPRTALLQLLARCRDTGDA